MVFIVYSQINDKNRHCSLGLPEYSYYFVLKGFLPALKELGQTLVVSNPEQEVDAIYDACREKGEECVFISFTPPNKAAVGLRCPTFCVVAWEFDSIPDEAWDNEPKNDWRVALADHGRVVMLSEYSVQSVKKAMGNEFPVAAIPAAVWDAFQNIGNHTDASFSKKQSVISIKGVVVDSRNYLITDDSFKLLNVDDYFQFKNWTGEKLHLGFSKTDEFGAYLGGFYKEETWGSWSRLEQPWILIPYRISGLAHLTISALGYGRNANKRIDISLGNEKKRFRLKKYPTEVRVTFRLSKPANILTFSGLDVMPLPGAIDPRTMGIGLRHIEITGKPDMEQNADNQQNEQATRHIKLDGVVYTSVLNPIEESRKNWEAIIIAFCTAFQDTEDATLVLKMSHDSLSFYLNKLHSAMHELSPFKCRILALQGYMESFEYEKLVAATDFYVNASRCEGLCLPLMEFMACRKPVIAPYHTAMIDYIDSSCALIVDSSLEPCMWPHDTRRVFRAMRYRINLESLVNAFRQSYDIAKNRTAEYEEMGKSASLRIKNFASKQVVKEKLQAFLCKALGWSF